MRRRVFSVAGFALVSAVAVACGGGDATVSTAAPLPAPQPAPEAAPTQPAVHGVDLAILDRSVRPGNDFYGYANGGWSKTAEIPADRAVAGGWLEVVKVTEDRTVALLEDAAAGRLAPAEQSDSARKAGDYFASYLDEATLDKLGVHPLAPLFARIAAIKDKRELAAALGRQMRTDVDDLNTAQVDTRNLFGLWIDQDLNDPTRTTPFLLQGGLGMPDRSYYLDKSAPMEAIRAHYEQHLVKLMQLAGVPGAEAKAKRVVALETKIAEAHAPRTETYDVKTANHPWKREDFPRLAPGLDWTAYFDAAQLKDQKDYGVWQPHAVTGIAALVGGVPLATWKEYLVVQALDGRARILSKPFVDEDFAFYKKELQGTPQMLPRAKRGAYRVTDDFALGDAVGQIYVARHFRAEDKRAISEMVAGIIEAFRQRIDALPWMAPETKAKAKEKLARLYVGVGYPDKWRDYDGLEIKRDDLFGNVQRIEEWRYRRQLAKLGKPADQKEWVEPAPIVDACNLPVRNALNFPAGILQPPFYRPGAPAVVNYAAIGAVIGHEISHSFDNQGAAFDASGRYVNWWTPADLTHFEASSAALAAQYSAYRPFPDLAIDGKRTLPENIADVAGLAAAHDAWIASLGGKPSPVIDGLTGEQQFFLAYEQMWRVKMRDEATRDAVKTDGHALPEYRARTVRNLDAWYPAFEVKPTDALYLTPEARVRVW